MKNYFKKVSMFWVNFQKMTTKTDVVGYLPDERPSFWKTLLFALQQFLVMIPATVLAAIIMGIYSIPAAIIASGVATLSFLIITKGKIPLYYGSSFSYIPAVAIITNHSTQIGATSHAVFGSIMIASILSGGMSITAGLIIKKFGKEHIDKLLPGHITGMIAMIIGLSLAQNTISGVGGLLFPNGETKIHYFSLLVGLITFLVISIITLKKGFISQISILIGLGIGVVSSYLFYIPNVHFSWNYKNIADYLSKINSGTVGLFDNLPHQVIPAAFQNSGLLLTAIFAIFPIAFATIPESTAHINQIDLYINDLAKRKKSDSFYPVSSLLGQNLIGDGIADIIAVLTGGPAGTNYGENISVSAITKNFSSAVFGFTGLFSIIIGFALHFLGNIDISLLLTSPVINGVSLYLFGAIAIQGIALMIEKRIDIFNARIVAVMAFIGIVGLGAPNGIAVSNTIVLPGIGVAAIGGIFLNLTLQYFESNLKIRK